jgi:penicillin amidase
MPYLYNPPTGYVAAANNKTTTDAYPYKFTYDWFHPGYRARSLVNNLNSLISNGKPVTVEDMQKLQGDNYSYLAAQLNPYLADLQPDNPFEAKVLDYAKKWDARFDLDSIGASIYSAWYTYLDGGTFDDELSQKKVWGYFFPLKHMESLAQIMKNPTNAWFDNVYTTNKIETRDDIVKISFKKALQFLTLHYGSDPARWNFGRVQTTRLYHPLFGRGIPVISSLFSSGETLPFSGSPTSIAFAYSDHFPPNAYNVTFAATQRHIVSFDNPDNMLSVVSSGSSMQLFNPHREDQMKMWSELKYHPMPFSKEGVAKAAKNQLTIIPSGAK